MKSGILSLFLALAIFGWGEGTTNDRVPCIKHLKSLNYNPMARQARLQGDVSLQITIDEDGKVQQVDKLPTEAHPLLRQEAVANIKRWTFRPAGKSEVTVTYEFRLVEPEVDGFASTTTSIDFPTRVQVTCNLKTANRN